MQGGDFSVPRLHPIIAVVVARWLLLGGPGVRFYLMLFRRRENGTACSSSCLYTCVIRFMVSMTDTGYLKSDFKIFSQGKLNLLKAHRETQ